MYVCQPSENKLIVGSFITMWLPLYYLLKFMFMILHWSPVVYNIDNDAT